MYPATFQLKLILFQTVFASETDSILLLHIVVVVVVGATIFIKA